MKTPSITLNDNKTIPQLGYGVWKIDNRDAAQAVETALETGYRHIDTAKIYENEKGVGAGIKASGLKRSDIFLTTKLWNKDQGYDSTLKAFEDSLKRLGTDYVDLYLIHWPVPAHDLYIKTWQALIHLREQGLAKSIGVSNFRIADLERLAKETGVIPAINQIELHPDFQQNALRAFHTRHHIATESWSPLGQGKIFDNPVLKTIARAHGKTVAQIILRWQIEMGNIAIPKSQSPERMAENFAIFNFSLTGADHNAIAQLDSKDGRIGADPNTFSG